MVTARGGVNGPVTRGGGLGTETVTAIGVVAPPLATAPPGAFEEAVMDLGGGALSAGRARARDSTAKISPIPRDTRR